MNKQGRIEIRTIHFTNTPKKPPFCTSPDISCPVSELVDEEPRLILNLPLMRNATAILYFSRSPEEELLEKKFHQERSRSFQIAHFLVTRTRNVLHKTNLPVFEIDSAHQKGSTPNERFDHALKALFGKGYEQVIAVGNDCLQLSAQDILDAKEHLTHKSLVLGPDLRGGAFLIGINKSNYRSEFILNAKWNKHNFLSSFSKNYQPEDIEYLQPLGDLNENIDQLSIKKVDFRKSLVRAFLTLFNPIIQTIVQVELRSERLATTSISRAPPLLL